MYFLNVSAPAITIPYAIPLGTCAAPVAYVCSFGLASTWFGFQARAEAGRLERCLRSTCSKQRFGIARAVFWWGASDDGNAILHRRKYSRGTRGRRPLAPPRAGMRKQRAAPRLVRRATEDAAVSFSQHVLASLNGPTRLRTRLNGRTLPRRSTHANRPRIYASAALKVNFYVKRRKAGLLLVFTQLC